MHHVPPKKPIDPQKPRVSELFRIAGRKIRFQSKSMENLIYYQDKSKSTIAKKKLHNERTPSGVSISTSVEYSSTDEYFYVQPLPRSKARSKLLAMKILGWSDYFIYDEISGQIKASTAGSCHKIREVRSCSTQTSGPTSRTFSTSIRANPPTDRDEYSALPIGINFDLERIKVFKKHNSENNIADLKKKDETLITKKKQYKVISYDNESPLTKADINRILGIFTITDYNKEKFPLFEDPNFYFRHRINPNTEPPVIIFSFRYSVFQYFNLLKIVDS